jgi:MFS family permease
MSLIAATLGRIAAPERRTMAIACGAHVLHDGFTDLLYVLLPLWQAEFGLGYAEIGLLRALYVGSMAGFQVPAGALAERFGGPLILGLGTTLAGIGYLVAGASAGFAVQSSQRRWSWAAWALVCSTRSARILSPKRSRAVARVPRSPVTISLATSARWRCPL